jgi:hypothetical protein
VQADLTSPGAILKRTIISAAVLTLLVGGVGVSVAEPGPNGNNNHGLCSAYFAGSENGQENKHKAGPFKALEEAADDGDPNTSVQDDVARFCAEFLSGNGNENGNNGNPEAERTPKGGGGL